MGLPLDFINKVNELAVNGIYPDLTIALDIDPNISLERSRSRLRQQNMFEAEGRFEQENMGFHQRVREGYLNIAKMQQRRFVVFDAELSIPKLSEQISKEVFDRIHKWMV